MRLCIPSRSVHSMCVFFTSRLQTGQDHRLNSRCYTEILGKNKITRERKNISDSVLGPELKDRVENHVFPPGHWSRGTSAVAVVATYESRKTKMTCTSSGSEEVIALLASAPMVRRVHLLFFHKLFEYGPTSGSPSFSRWPPAPVQVRLPLKARKGA